MCILNSVSGDTGFTCFVAKDHHHSILGLFFTQAQCHVCAPNPLGGTGQLNKSPIFPFALSSTSFHKATTLFKLHMFGANNYNPTLEKLEPL